MVEFLCLKVLIGDDLGETLRTWQANTEAAMDKLLRDLDAATQVSTILPSQNAAVGTALRQFRAAVQLRMALPLTRLDEAQEGMEEFIPPQGVAIPARDEEPDWGTFLEDYQPLR